MVANADTVKIDNGIGTVANSGSFDISPDGFTTYTLTATSPGGSSVAKATVKVLGYLPPTISFGASPQVIVEGQSTLLSWETTNATAVVIDQIGNVEINGSVAVTPDQMTTYTLTATGLGGITTANVKVFVYKGNQFDYGDPTPAEQAHLEAINRARLDPEKEASRLGIDLNEGLSSGTISSNPVQPLTFNAQLIRAAQMHTQDMMEKQYLSSNSMDGRTLADRITETGYTYKNNSENLFIFHSTSPLDETLSVLEAHDSFFIDNGVTGRRERKNILDKRFKEMGIGVVGGEYEEYPYAYLTTVDFASSGWRANSFLLGVVYDDTDGDGSYTPGEGVKDVGIEIYDTEYGTVTATAGGYGIPLPPGEYTVIATLPNGYGAIKPLSINDKNIKLDFLKSDFTAPPAVTFEADDTIVLTGESSTLTWAVTGADTVSLNNGIGAVDPEGTLTVTPAATTTYTLTASGSGGIVERQVTIYIVDPSKAPVAELTAASTTLAEGKSTTLSWEVTDADTVSIDNGIGSVEPIGSVAISPAATTTYHLTASGPGGSTSASVTVTVTHPKPTASISADKTIIEAGDAVLLSWKATNSDSVTITPGIGTVEATGSLSVSPASTTTYTITAEGAGGTVSSDVTVTVTHPLPAIEFNSAAAAVVSGQSASLSWNVTNAETVVIDNGIGTVETSGNVSVSPTATTVYTLTGTGPGGTSTRSVTVTVVNPTDPPVIVFLTSADAVQSGGSATLSWTVVNAESITIDNGIGTVANSGTSEVSPTVTTAYTLTATGSGGASTATVTVRVSNIGVTITSPADGAILTARDVMVKGTFTNPTGKETGITVNGVLASVYGNEFVANNVLLQEGDNTITVIATDVSGDTNTAEIAVTAELPEEYIRIIALAESGAAPFETTLRVEGSFSFTADQPTYTGPGAVEITASSEENGYKVSMTAPGVYYFKAETTYANATYQADISIVVLNKDELDALLQAKWAGLKTALGDANIEESLAYLSSGSKENFEYNFNLLGEHLAEIASCYHDLTFIKAVDETAEYNVLCDQEGTTYSFYMAFAKDADGIWRIKFF